MLERRCSRMPEPRFAARPSLVMESPRVWTQLQATLLRLEQGGPHEKRPVGDGPLVTPLREPLLGGGGLRRELLRPLTRRLARVFGDEVLRELPRLVVRALRMGRLHQVARGAVELARDAVVQRELRDANSVDDDPGRVRRVPDLELELRGQRHVPERLALEPDVRPLAVGEPGDVVGGADVDVVRGEFVAHDRRDGVRLRLLLRGEPLALEHVVEVHVAADVELRGALEPDAALVEQPRELAVDDGGAHLRLDVVADDRQPVLGEALVPIVLAGDEDRQAVDEPDAGLKRLLDVPLGRLLGADRQVADEDVGPGLLEDPDHVVGRPRGLGDLLLQILAEAVVGHAAMNRDTEVGDVGELDRVVLAGPERLAEVLADLLGVDVEGGAELDVANVVTAEVHMHEAGDLLGGIGVLVVGDALDQGVRAVADPHDRDANLAVVDQVAVSACAVVRSVLGAHCVGSPPRGWEPATTPHSCAGYTSGSSSSARSSPRTCQTRWTTVTAVSAAIA